MSTPTLPRHWPGQHVRTRATRKRAAGSSVACPVTAATPVPSPAAPRTVAGTRAMARRRARISADRRPPSGLVPSSGRTGAVVRADHGHRLRERQFQPARWLRLACALSLAATTVMAGIVVLAPAGTTVVREVTVAPGDTLWSIARRADPEADTLAELEKIRQLNGLVSDNLMAGWVLRVPTSGG